jgi:bifunctional oligoribonuclease and PAP phosphatase NrnA
VKSQKKDPATSHSADFVAKIQAAKTIWLTTHPQADGDGLACQAAMASALHGLGKTAKIMNFEPPGAKYRFLFEQATGRRLMVAVFDADLDPAPPDLIILFDTNDFRLIETMAEWASEQGVPIAVLDHHQGLPPQGTVAWTDTEAASSGEVLLSLLNALGVEIGPNIATPLYASLVFDTQNFRFIRASARSHSMAARLLPLVSEPEKIHEALFAHLTPTKLGFIASSLSAMRIEAEGTLAVLVLPREIFTRYSADLSDSGDVIDMALNVGSVKIALLLREEDGGKWKVSMRSKRGFSVLEAALEIGGGGHANAAGATISEPPQDIESQLKPLLLKEIRSKMQL